MNYYPFHIGDYASATRHLSWDEDAAYRRLLDAYYTTERALPIELRAVFRLVVATTDAQREAVETVLNEFFTLTTEGWINKRAEAELESMREKQQKQRNKANARWNKQRSEGVDAATDAPAMPRHNRTDAAASIPDADAMPPTPTPTPTPTPKEKTSAPNAVAFDAVTGQFEIPDLLTTQWRGAYPALSLDAELSKASAWLLANPKNRKSNYARFLTNWLMRAQDKAPRVNGTVHSAADPFAGAR